MINKQEPKQAEKEESAEAARGGVGEADKGPLTSTWDLYYVMIFNLFLFERFCMGLNGFYWV